MYLDRRAYPMNIIYTLFERKVQLNVWKQSESLNNVKSFIETKCDTQNHV